MSAPDRMTLIEELRLIGCHQNGDARCTCVVGNEAADIVQELAEALEEISEIDDVCRRNVAFRKSLGWYEDETIRVRDQHNAMAWAEAAKIARAALADERKEGE